MSGVMSGVRVIEVAGWTFVPAACAILGDLGAEVIKVEPPTGDPQRGMSNMLNLDHPGVNPFLEIPNRSKRSITLDLRNDVGRSLLMQLVGTADVFVTSYLTHVRQKLGIDVDDLRGLNPRLIYVRGSGWGSAGPMSEVGGYDQAAGYASSGMAYRLTKPGGEPALQPMAFVDLQGANAMAGATAMALYQRERTGLGSTVDISLLNVGMWAMSPDLVAAPFTDFVPPSRTEPGNPLVNWYRTRDDRWITLVCLQADRFWGELCELLQRPDLTNDPRFVDAGVRYENRRAAVKALDDVFASRTLQEWRQVLAGFSGVWAPVASFREVHAHPQVQPNGYLADLTSNEGVDFKLVSVPMQFDGEPSRPSGPAPDVGQHTEEILLEAGLSWDQISNARAAGALG